MEGVISVPSFFDQHQRTIVMEAARVSGINCYNLISDTAALAVYYGFPKVDLPTDVSTYVIFILIGHAYSTAAVCEFRKDNFSV
jgi:molecular chaperone DnaK (HSP70)